MNQRRPGRKAVASAWVLALAGALAQGADPVGAVEAAEEALYTLPGLDHGLMQSPVNILTQSARSGRHTVLFHDDHVAAQAVRNTGHSVQLPFGAGATVDFEGKRYAFSQCHFHTPSEHQIDGVTFPMEMHCVSATAQGDPPDYLVMGFLFKMGAESAFLSKFVAAIPGEANTDASLPQEPLYLEDIAREGSTEQGYYTYRGSLTTAPYTESVRWLVLKHVLQASPAQIERINAAEGNNARHVQALFGRIVDQQ
ncbi:MAG: carbonic anhydrase family protein [Pseudomonadota bacterium]